MKISLCGKGELPSCPAVEITLCGDGNLPSCPAVKICGKGDLPACPEVNTTTGVVTIGETGNMVKLKPSEWNRMVDLIKEGKLKKV